MEIKQYVWDVVDSNSFLIIENNKGLLIDAVENRELYEELTELDELTIILTHAHFDHIIGLNNIRNIIPNCRVIATEQCSQNIGNKYRNMSSSANAYVYFYNGNSTTIEPFICDRANLEFVDDYSFKWFGHYVKLESLHGHSSDGLIVLFDDNLVFSGDSLLNVPTITRFPGGSNKRFLEEDIPKFIKLMKNVEMVYPGHGEVGKLAYMLKVNKVL